MPDQCPLPPPILRDGVYARRPGGPWGRFVAGELVELLEPEVTRG